jgi:hypothetical protein
LRSLDSVSQTHSMRIRTPETVSTISASPIGSVPVNCVAPAFWALIRPRTSSPSLGTVTAWAAMLLVPTAPAPSLPVTTLPGASFAAPTAASPSLPFVTTAGPRSEVPSEPFTTLSFLRVGAFDP